MEPLFANMFTWYKAQTADAQKILSRTEPYFLDQKTIDLGFFLFFG